MSIVKIPDLGGASTVTVIEILVNPGDHVEIDQPLVTLESEKATMEVPATAAGTIKNIMVKVNDSVSEGMPMIEIEALDQTDATTTINEAAEDTDAVSLETVLTPDLGGTSGATVIELLVQSGDQVEVDQPLLTLEGEKATMEVPAPSKGTVKSVLVAVDTLVQTGTPLFEVEVQSSVAKPQKSKLPPSQPIKAPAQVDSVNVEVASMNANVYSSPGVRRYAREFGIDLSQIKGTGEKSRVTKSDLIQFVKARMAGASGTGSAIPSIPEEDFSQYGAINMAPLSKIKQFTAKNMQRNWLNVPHVTQFHEVEITKLSQAYQELRLRLKKKGQKVTMLPFIMKALVNSLKAHPEFNASLHPDGKQLILKSYFNIGIAVDTPQGLVVPVIKDVDQKNIMTISDELRNISTKAREKGLTPQEMKGGSMTISNLGGIGGGHFTPIINVPEVAILGVSRQVQKPTLVDGQWQADEYLPISLSYDHRVIDGAQGARFLMHLSDEITNIVSEILVGDSDNGE